MEQDIVRFGLTSIFTDIIDELIIFYEKHESFSQYEDEIRKDIFTIIVQGEREQVSITLRAQDEEVYGSDSESEESYLLYESEVSVNIDELKQMKRKLNYLCQRTKRAGKKC